MSEIRINCYGYGFTQDMSANDAKNMSLEDLINMCEILYYENHRLEEKIEDMEQDIEDNYKRIDVADQYDVDDNDFI